MIQFLAFGLSILWASASVFASGNEGSLELVYEPKFCVMEPCPQFRVISMNGDPTSAKGADLTNLDPTTSSLRNFRRIKVTGSWEQDKDYLKVRVSEWSAVISEKVEPSSDSKDSGKTNLKSNP